MKRAYSEFRLLPKELRTFFEIATKEELFNFVKQGRQSRGITTCDEHVRNDMSVLLRICLADELVRAGNCTHLFFTDPHMHDWLKKCGSDLRDEQIAIIRSTCQSFAVDPARQKKGFVFMLHFPGGGAPVYLCMLGGYNWGNENASENDWWFLLCDRTWENAHWLNRNPIVDDNSHLSGIISVVSSGLAYMKCFPETVLAGIPADLKHPNHYRKGTLVSVSMQQSLIVRDGPSPHFRQGHFRCLNSPYFVNRQGEIIFIQGTFVKGRAKTVLSPEEVDQLHFGTSEQVCALGAVSPGILHCSLEPPLLPTYIE